MNSKFKGKPNQQKFGIRKHICSREVPILLFHTIALELLYDIQFV